MDLLQKNYISKTNSLVNTAILLLSVTVRRPTKTRKRPVDSHLHPENDHLSIYQHPGNHNLSLTYSLGTTSWLENPGGIGVATELLHEEIVVSWEHEGGGQEVQVDVSACGADEADILYNFRR